MLCTPKNKNKCVAYLNVCRYKLIANSELFVTFRLRVFHSNITISTLNTAKAAAIRSNEVAALQSKLHQEGPGFDHISSPHLSRPEKVRGHSLMSLRVQSGKGVGGLL